MIPETSQERKTTPRTQEISREENDEGKLSETTGYILIRLRSLVEACYLPNGSEKTSLSDTTSEQGFSVEPEFLKLRLVSRRPVVTTSNILYFQVPIFYGSSSYFYRL